MQNLTAAKYRTLWAWEGSLQNENGKKPQQEPFLKLVKMKSDLLDTKRLFYIQTEK